MLLMTAFLALIVTLISSTIVLNILKNIFDLKIVGAGRWYLEKIWLLVLSIAIPIIFFCIKKYWKIEDGRLLTSIYASLIMLGLVLLILFSGAYL